MFSWDLSGLPTRYSVFFPQELLINAGMTLAVRIRNHLIPTRVPDFVATKIDPTVVAKHHVIDAVLSSLKTYLILQVRDRMSNDVMVIYVTNMLHNLTAFIRVPDTITPTVARLYWVDYQKRYAHLSIAHRQDKKYIHYNIRGDAYSVSSVYNDSISGIIRRATSLVEIFTVMRKNYWILIPIIIANWLFKRYVHCYLHDKERLSIRGLESRVSEDIGLGYADYDKIMKASIMKDEAVLFRKDVLRSLWHNMICLMIGLCVRDTKIITSLMNAENFFGRFSEGSWRTSYLGAWSVFGAYDPEKGFEYSVAPKPKPWPKQLYIDARKLTLNQGMVIDPAMRKPVQVAISATEKDGTLIVIGPPDTDFHLVLPDLRIRHGDKILVTGCSGEGKTTLLRLICGHIYGLEGRIGGSEQTQKTCQMQDFSHQMTFLDHSHQYMFAEQWYKPPSEFLHPVHDVCDKAKAEKYLTLCGLKKFAIMSEGANLSSCSSGEKVRFLLARTLYMADVKQLPVLILDEPDQACDAGTSYDLVRKALAEFADRTIIVTSHTVGMKDACKFDQHWTVSKGVVSFFVWLFLDRMGECGKKRQSQSLTKISLW